MKNYFIKIPAFLLTLAIVFVASGFVYSQTAKAAVACQIGSLLNANITTEPECGRVGGKLVQTTPNQDQAIEKSRGTCGYLEFDCQIMQKVLPGIVTIILKFVSYLTGLGGLVLNGVIFHTIVNISKNYKEIGVIDEAWGTIRDIANMAFIFVLLYAAIQTILGIGKDTKQLIVRVVVVAILINFSLFFTMFVIDLANVLALTFYDAMVPNAAQEGFTGRGLSNAFMQHLNLQNLYRVEGSEVLSVGSIITTGIMGTIMLLISAFVFLAVALLFIIRYVVLIIVLILSPIAFISYILPQTEKYRSQWSEALINQSFFAPVYFALTWITLKILGGVTSVLGATNTAQTLDESGFATTTAGIVANQATIGFVPTFINFAVVIAFLIISLVIAKEWASKTAGGVGKLTSWATGVAGGATFGMAGRLGRNTIGRAGQMLGESKYLKDKIEGGGARGMAARLALKAGRKTATQSFDMRGTGLVDVADAGKAQKGGYEAVLKKKREDEKKFADSLAPTDEEKQAAQAMRTRLENDPEASLDPRFEREYQLQAQRNNDRADKFEDQANDKERKLNAGRGRMSRQEIYDAEEEIRTLRSKAISLRKDAETPQNYIDSVLGVDSKERGKRQGEIDKQRGQAIEVQNTAYDSAKKRTERDKSESEKVENERFENEIKVADQELEARTREAKASLNKAVSEDPIIAEEKKVQAAKVALEAEVKNRENELNSIVIDELRDQKRSELDQKRRELETLQERAELITQQANERTVAIEKPYREALDRIEREYQARKTANQQRHADTVERNKINYENRKEADERSHETTLEVIKTDYDERKNAIKEVDSAAERRKKSRADSLEKGWVTGKAGRKLEGLADRLAEDTRASRTAAASMRAVARAISHKNRAAAAEIRKGKKPVRDQLEEILRDQGDIPPATPPGGGGGPAPTGGGGPTTP